MNAGRTRRSGRDDSDNQVGYETAEVVGDQGVRLADAHTGGFLSDDPAADHGVVPVEGWQGEEFLVDIAFFPVFAGCVLHDGVVLYNGNIGAFPGKDRLLYIAGQPAGFKI